MLQISLLYLYGTGIISFNISYFYVRIPELGLQDLISPNC